MGIDIREFDGRHESAILDLHKQVFGAVLPGHYNDNIRIRAKSILHKGRSAIAVDGRQLVGFGLSASVGNMPVCQGGTERADLEVWLARAKAPQQSEQLEEMLSEQRGHRVSVRMYSNQFIRSTDGIATNDWDLDGLAVLPEYRGQGIGKLLTKKRLEFAQDENAAAVYSTLHLTGKGIGQLYTHLGFSPLLKITPSYPDGSAAKYVGKKL